MQTKDKISWIKSKNAVSTVSTYALFNLGSRPIGSISQCSGVIIVFRSFLIIQVQHPSKVPIWVGLRRLIGAMRVTWRICWIVVSSSITGRQSWIQTSPILKLISQRVRSSDDIDSSCQMSLIVSAKKKTFDFVGKPVFHKLILI